jgi:hypothetical protein
MRCIGNTALPIAADAVVQNSISLTPERHCSKCHKELSNSYAKIWCN